MPRPCEPCLSAPLIINTLWQLGSRLLELLRRVLCERLKGAVRAREWRLRVLAAARLPHQAIRVVKEDVLARPEREYDGALVESVDLIDREARMVVGSAAGVLVDSKEFGKV